MAEDEDEKTEEPTEHKLDKAREEGNVAKSAEIVGAAVLTFGSFYMLFFAGFSYEKMMALMKYSFSSISKGMNSDNLYAVSMEVYYQMMLTIAPFLAIALIFTVASSLMQFGFLLAPLKFDIQKLDPIKGFGNVFSMKKLIEALKLTAKLMVVFVALFTLFMIYAKDIIYMMMSDFAVSIHSLFNTALVFILVVLFIIIIFAIIDYYFILYNYMKSNRMTKQEVKDEFKNMEGDPQVKGRIRALQMKMSRQSMMNDVAESDVVITNPTHYAVALKYDKEKNDAPLITAKGINFIAVNIKKLALKYDVPIIENAPLARALYAQKEVGETIPEEFYKAVADIFTYIYELKNKNNPNRKPLED
jgi:flagellar biosynthetic protein FlhB